MFRKFAQSNVVKTHVIGTSKFAYYITCGLMLLAFDNAI